MGESWQADHSRWIMFDIYTYPSLHAAVKLAVERNVKQWYVEQAGMAQWWEHSPPTNVARVPVDSRTHKYMSWVCCWLSSLLWDVLLRVLRLSPLLKNLAMILKIIALSLKNNISKFRFFPRLKNQHLRSILEVTQLAFCAKNRWQLNNLIYLCDFIYFMLYGWFVTDTKFT